jgi:hypothetical protein
MMDLNKAQRLYKAVLERRTQPAVTGEPEIGLDPPSWRGELIRLVAWRYVARISGEARPKGVHKPGGGFFPGESERAECCRFVTPKKRYQHCQSLAHVMALHGLDHSDLPDLEIAVAELITARKMAARLRGEKPVTFDQIQSEDR